MITKVYDKTKQILRENWKFLIGFVIFIFLVTYQFPYYINTPGGLISVTDRVSIEGAYPSKGSFNMAYVSELKATLPTLFFSLFQKDWDIYKEEDVTYDNESIEDTYFRDHLLLQEATNNALIVGFTKAGKKVEITGKSLIVTHVDQDAIADLKVGDEIISVNDVSVSDRASLDSIIVSMKKGDRLKIQVLHNSKKIERFAELRMEENRLLIGILLTEKKEVETTPKVTLKFKKSESGPSGGLMTSLAIYNYLTEEDITKGRKIVGTGTIDEDGNVGSIGGVKYKIKGAVKQGATLFLVPKGENYEEAIRVKEENKYDITIIAIGTFDEALEYLMDL